MATSLPAKMGLEGDARAYASRMPASVAHALAAAGVPFASRLSGAFTHMHAFFVSAAELDRRFARLRRHLAAGGALWVSWPKKGQLDSDLSLPKVIEIGYRHGLVESKTIGVDDTWSAIKFTHPKKGKTYANSFGKLPETDD